MILSNLGKKKLEENLGQFHLKINWKTNVHSRYNSTAEKRNKKMCIDESDKSFSWRRLFDFVIYND